MVLSQNINKSQSQSKSVKVGQPRDTCRGFFGFRLLHPRPINQRSTMPRQQKLYQDLNLLPSEGVRKQPSRRVKNPYATKKDTIVNAQIAHIPKKVQVVFQVGENATPKAFKGTVITINRNNGTCRVKFAAAHGFTTETRNKVPIDRLQSIPKDNYSDLVVANRRRRIQ